MLGALLGFLLFSSAQASPIIPDAPKYSVTLTAYNAVTGQTDDNPFETASGAYSNPEVIAARSQDMSAELPFGTVIAIESATTTSPTCGYSSVSRLIGYRVIEDTMNARYKRYVDVLLPTDQFVTHEDGRKENVASVLGVCRGVTVRVVGRVDFKDIPKTQAELASLVNGKADGLALNK